MKKYIYHYYAELPRKHSMDSWDGIVSRNSPIESMDDYRELKKFLLEYFKEDKNTSMIIKSINLLDTK